MANTRGQRLRAARERSGFKSARLAALALGIAISTYGAHERAESAGGRDFGPDEAKLYARRFGVSPEWLLTGRRQGLPDEFPGIASPNIDAPKVPVVGYVGAGGEVHTYAVAEDGLDQVEQPHATPNTTVAVEICSDVLGPFFERWLLFYDSIQRPVTPSLVGHLCVAGLPDRRTFIRQLQRGSSDGVYNLLSPGQQSMIDVKLEWAAPIKSMAWRRRRN